MPNTLTQEVIRNLRTQGKQFPGSDDDLTLALGALNRPDLMENQEFFEDYNAIREANSPGTIGGLVNTVKNAWGRTVQAKNVFGTPGAVDAQDIAEQETAIRNRPGSVPWEDWQNPKISAVKTWLRDPVEISANIIASGFAGSLPAIGAGLAGGALGSLASPVGGVIGAMAGTGAGSLAVEYGSKYLDVLREAGADLEDPESIMRVINDPEIRARAERLGLQRGLPVAAFDSISAGIAGRFGDRKSVV